MSNQITYVVELIDNFSAKALEIQAAMKGISNQVEGVKKSFGSFNECVNSGLQKASMNANKLRSGLTNLNKPLEDVTSNAEDVVQTTARASQSIWSKLFSGASLNSVTKFGENLRKHVTLPLGASMFMMLRAHQQLQTLAAGFGGALGGEEKGKAFVNQLQKFGQKTPFELKDIMQAATQFVAVGEPVKDIIPDLKIMGDVAAMSGVHINDLAQELTKIKSRGRMYQMDLNILSTHHINMIKLIQDHIKIAGSTAKLTTEQIRKLVSSGALTYNMTMNLLRALTAKGGLAHNQMIIHLHTLLGATRNTKDNLYQLSAAIGQNIDDSLNLSDNMLLLAQHMAKATNNFAKFTAKHKSIMNLIIRFSTFVVVLGVVMKVISMVGKIFTTVFSPMIALSRTLVAAITGLDVAAVGLGAAFGWAAGFALVVAGIYYTFTHWKQILTEIETLWDKIVKGFKNRPKMLSGVESIGGKAPDTSAFKSLFKKSTYHLDSMKKASDSFNPLTTPGNDMLMIPQLIAPIQTQKHSSKITLNVNDRSNIIGGIHSQHSGGVDMRVGKNMWDS